ncbi:MAG: LacI family DNA-binding transcriptional regulator [Alphaproteobacteria bacterium]|nr:LacI family DNA-binding transcriptional regulator [Alphaproteobacteria bacterium]
MKDVAKAAGVSVMTVSRAFKADTSVKKETREEIRKVAEDLGYVFDSTAANLRSQKTDFVGITIPSINNANFADTVGGLSDKLATKNLQVILGYTNYDIEEEERLVEQLLRRRPEAMVVTGGRHTERTRRLLVNAGIPVIETWDLPQEPIGHVVGFSNAATMQATTRLIGAGTPPISMHEGAEAMGRLLDDLPDTDAVVCVSDLSAFGALSECQRRGVKVPEDIAIAGFGAYEIADICVPTITTVDPHPRQIGEQVATLILSGLESQAEPVRIAIEPNLVIRQSTQSPS